MPTYHYVYILVSESRPTETYIGYTTHLRRRLAEHNAGKARFTSRHRPWRLRAAIALASRERALDLERSLPLQVDTLIQRLTRRCRGGGDEMITIHRAAHGPSLQS